MPHAGTHDSALVALSILIAAAASYTALDLAARMRATTGWSSRAWLAAALAMGGGIWSMHFVAMLAFSLPGLEVGYDLRLTL
ncbi:MAG: sensor histidine kinase, partial [Parafilimonas terrae]|nr:sensor histidine kinase [Parafilimonas terrae]